MSALIKIMFADPGGVDSDPDPTLKLNRIGPSRKTGVKCFIVLMFNV